jgi:hypothetical protein
MKQAIEVELSFLEGAVMTKMQQDMNESDEIDLMCFFDNYPYSTATLLVPNTPEFADLLKHSELDAELFENNDLDEMMGRITARAIDPKEHDQYKTVHMLMIKNYHDYSGPAERMCENDLRKMMEHRDSTYDIEHAEMTPTQYWFKYSGSDDDVFWVSTKESAKEQLEQTGSKGDKNEEEQHTDGKVLHMKASAREQLEQNGSSKRALDEGDDETIQRKLLDLIAELPISAEGKEKYSKRVKGV